MGIMSFIRSQLIEIIEWLDDTNYTLVWRFPDDDHEIKNGAKLVCREGQAAVLINEGKLADVFGPGTHTLSTQNMPILSTLKGWKYGFESPFKVEIYFINLKQYLDQKWGTANPVLVRDPEFAVGNRPGRVRIRAYGSYNFKIVDPGTFFREIVGTNSIVTTEEIERFLKSRLVSSFTSAAGKSELSVADMAAHYDVLAKATVDSIGESFSQLGLKLTSFIIENISLPPEVEKALDAAAAQSARGVDNTMQWEAMQAMRDVASNAHLGQGSGVMNAGMGLGMGMGMGNMMGGMMGQGMGYPPGYPPPQGYPGQPGYPPPGYPPPGYPPPQGYPGQPGYPPPGYPQGAPPPQGAAPPAPPAPPAPAAPAGDDIQSKLMKLKAAFDAGLLTQQEYDAKKQQLLASF
jgi:membrane protease subunit (stomatin/prohibitin family)